MGTTGFGIFFILFGILLYFDSVLLAFGNVSPPACVPPPPTYLRSLWKVGPKSIQIMPFQGSARAGDGGWGAQ